VNNATVFLLRQTSTSEGVYGRLFWPGLEVPIYTAEKPNLDNQPNISCIPEGIYLCSPEMYNKGGYMAFGIRNVPGRSNILIHKGNGPPDVKGCVVVGLEVGTYQRIRGVLNSAGAWEYLLRDLGGKAFYLQVCT